VRTRWQPCLSSGGHLRSRRDPEDTLSTRLGTVRHLGSKIKGAVHADVLPTPEVPCIGAGRNEAGYTSMHGCQQSGGGA
jgi:hypothetical protein